MNESLFSSDRQQQLRRLAENKLKELDPDAMGKKPPQEVRQLIHELQVYQVEMEMQQEELFATTHALQESEAKYRYLYLFAPNGYFTVNAQGGILEMNFAAARLLGLERRMATGNLLRNFIGDGSRSTFDDFFYQLLYLKTPQRCELPLSPGPMSRVW
jgi:PAS domain-containing protein